MGDPDFCEKKCPLNCRAILVELQYYTSGPVMDCRFEVHPE
jgi:hypothetical protein